MHKLIKLLEIQILGNTLQRYLLAMSIFLGLIFALKFLERVVIRRLKTFSIKWPGHHGEVLKINPSFIETVEKTLIPLSYFGAFYLAVTQLVLDPSLFKGVRAVAVVVLTVQMTRLALAFCIYFVDEIWIKKLAQQENALVSSSILTIMKIGIWGLGLVFVLDNLGFNVSAIVAGLGITGVAVALAAQTILGDLFNYFVIFFDKPFTVGDAITIGGHSGTVEHIGIKTTRIRSVTGEQLIFSNSYLTSNPIVNSKRMHQRRVQFKLGLEYGTSVEQMKKVPDMIKKIIEIQNDVRFERAHFGVFSDSSLDIDIVYYILENDYIKYMDIQEKINLAIKEAFEREKIEFAYPSRAVYLKTAPDFSAYPNTPIK